MEGQPLSPSQVPYQYQATSMSGAEEQKEPADAEPSSLRQRIRGENAENPHQSNRQPSHDNPFECNVCLEPLQDPVCTLCGHLYCWPCLYRWLNTGHTTCPVCKAGVTNSNVVPIYVRGNETDPRTRDIPNRPPSQRPVPEPSTAGGLGNLGGIPGMVNGQFGGMNFTAGVGFFPSLFGLQFQAFANNGQGPQMRPLTPQELEQLNTSRFLMMLGMVVMVILMFF